MMKGIIVAIALFLASAVTSAQWLKYPTPGIPRTADGKPNLSAPAPRGADGKPDLSGIWTRSAVAPGWDLRKLRESGAFTDQNLAYHRPPDASIPFQPWAEALFRERQARNGAGAPSERCLPTGIPEATLEPPPFKIAQMNGLTIILFEAFNRYRQIFTDGRPAPVDPDPSWWGYSTGKWDADTFVVDTVGFNDRTWLDKAGHPHSDALHTIERFRRLDFGRLELQVTIDDPKAYTRPWTATIPLRLLADTELIEDACENEQDAARIEAIASQGAKQQASIVGTWERVFRTDEQGQPVANPYMVVMFSDDGVFAQINIAKDRPRIDKPLGQLTNEEFRTRFSGSQAVYGTYTISGDRLVRNVVGALNPSNEGTQLTSVFRIEGDTMIARDSDTKAEGRFKRVRNGSLSPR